MEGKLKILSESMLTAIVTPPNSNALNLSNSLGRIKLTNSLGKQQLAL